MIKLKEKCFFLLCYLLTFCDVALARPNTDLGGIAKNLNAPLKGVTSIMLSICLVAGVGLVVGGLIRYLQHRKNPVEATLGSCIALLLAGLALIALTFAPLPNTR